MAYGKRKRSYSRARPRKFRKRRVAPKRKASIKRVVKKVIASTLETKCVSINQGAWFNNTVSGSGDVINMIPGIVKGIANNQRIGTTVTPKGLFIKGYLQLGLSDNDLARANVGVRIIIGYPKGYTSTVVGQNLCQDWQNDIIDNGENTVGLDGSIQNTWLGRINTRKFCVFHDKKIVLKQPYTRYFLGPELTDAPGGPLSMDVSKTTKMFGFKVPYKAPWKYCKDGNTDRTFGGTDTTTPTTVQSPPATAALPDYTTFAGSGLQGIDYDDLPIKNSCFMLISYCYLDGSSPAPLPVVAALWRSDLYYTDA